MKRNELVKLVHEKERQIMYWRDECLRLMREMTNLSQMKIECIPGEKEFAAMQAAMDKICVRNNELIKKVADLTAENEHIKKEREETAEKYYCLLAEYITEKEAQQ